MIARGCEFYLLLTVYLSLVHYILVRDTIRHSMTKFVSLARLCNILYG